MWSGPGPDPGGSLGTGPPSTQELNDLKDQFEQQQLLIAQLKEMLRKSEQTTVTQEKVEEYANTLTKMKARAKRSAQRGDGGKESSGKRVETPASEKINMLRQQLEENRVKLAERGKNQKGIEEMVTQLKAQLDDSQVLMSQTPLNLSLTDTKQESYSIDSTSQELYNILVNKEKRMSEMTARIQKLEANVLDLQENLKEKDSVIDARTKAITLMSENLSRKGKSTLDALDDTKLQMRKMQENFIELELQMKEENCRLSNEVEQKEIEIRDLKQQNFYLENAERELKDKSDDVDSISTYISGDVEKLQMRITELEGLSVVSGNINLDESNVLCKELQDTITHHVDTITDLESTIKDLQAQLSKSSGSKLANLDIKLENEELTKLKKQLDESNKNMIKVKAQHKSKVKELNKKIDSFKKMNDANAEVVKMHDENSKLNQKIAELEEDKGALQLKIMEADSTKDSTVVESINELEKRLNDQATQLSEKDTHIETLTKRMEESLKTIDDLNEKLNLQTVQVKSEMTTIHLEEQMDRLEMEKGELKREKEKVIEENASLTEKLEVLQKEKQEILTKLESYVQENMELVDKLEKLSAEKVSSAESIEIVEGLTQQEKMELEAYQKGAENPSGEISKEENPELSENVNRLTEETSELLRKIELFTCERREVMERMEQLTQENNQLNLRIKEIENNRDVLAETYEQLQNEKDQLDGNLEKLKSDNAALEDKIRQLRGDESTTTTKAEGTDRTMEDALKEIEEYKYLVEIQRQEIKELKVQIMGQEFVRTDKLELEAKVNSLQLQYENILAENDGHVRRREELEGELSSARKRIDEFERKVEENLREIDDYKSILEVNKNELISSANLIGELQSGVAALKNEVSHYNDEVTHLNSVITDLNAAITHLEEENEENSGKIAGVQTMSQQLEELKLSLERNIEEMSGYQSELEANSATIAQLQAEIKALNLKILDTEHLLDVKDDELRRAQAEKDEKDRIVRDLQGELKEKDEKFHRIVDDFKGKYLGLQKQLETNAGAMDSIRQPLEDKIRELEHKNKEQLEKMKIIAANLKKKTQAFQNLERKYAEANEKWETEQKEKETTKEIAAKNASLENEIQVLVEKLSSSQNDVANQSIECQKLKEELFDYKQRFNSVENMNTKLSEEISNYIARLEDAQNIIREFERTVSELRNSDEIVKDLTEQLENLKETSKANSDALQMKIQEMEMYVETQDAELTKYKERVNKLEEGLSYVEERRMSLERTAQRLGAELEEKTNECDEVTQTEDILEKRLSALISHDQVIEKKLQEVTAENEELHRQLKGVTGENDDLNRKLKEMKDQVSSAQDDREALATMENEILSLRKTVTSLENGKRSIQNEFEQRLKVLKEDNEKTEVELQNQLDSLDQDRRNFAEKSERMTDQLKEYAEQNEVLAMEIGDYKNKLDEQTKVMMTNIEAYEKLRGEFERNLLALNQLKEINGHQENVISGLNEEIVQIRNAVTEKEGTITKAEETIAKLNRNEEIQAEKMKELEDDLRQKSIDLENARKELGNDLRKKSIDLENIRKELENDLRQKSIDLENVRKELENDLQQKSIDLENAQKEIASLQFEAMPIQSSQVQLTPIQSNQFDLASSFFADPDTQHLKQTNENLQKQIASLQQENGSVRKILAQTQSDLEQNRAVKEEVSKSEPSSKSDEVKNLKAQYNTLEMNYGRVSEENASLQNHIAALTGELEKLNRSNQSPMGTFIWPGEEVVEEKILPAEATSGHKIQNTKEELLDKIRSLEFMLHDAEQQRDQALMQSNTLSGELAKILYLHEQENLRRPATLELDLESQILPPETAKITAADLSQLRQFEFAPSEDIVDHQGPSAAPVVEEAINPTSTYLCYDPEDGDTSKVVDDAFGENDDGWGWGPDEAKLEQEHYDQASASAVPPQSLQFKTQIGQLEEKIKVLEQARERHLEEIQRSQLKSTKLIKKLKEFKSKNEELASQVTKKSDGFDDLNDAIQEELKAQIGNLEKRIKETQSELEKEKLEKKNLTKRVDTLTASHERMVENKEKQDVEIMSWQQRCRELTSKLEQFEWGDDSPKHVAKVEVTDAQTVDAGKIRELTDTIRDLTLDNEELQALLEEQRNLRIAAEKAKSMGPIVENMKTEQEFSKVLEERDDFERNFRFVSDELERIKVDYSDLLGSNEEMLRELKRCEVENGKLQEQVGKADKSLMDKIDQLNMEKQKLIEDQAWNASIIEELTGKLQNLQSIDQLNMEKQKLMEDLAWNASIIEELTGKLQILQSNFDAASNDRTKYEEIIVELNKTLASLNEKNGDLEGDKQKLSFELQRKDSENAQLNQTIAQLNGKIQNVETQTGEVGQMRDLLAAKDAELSALLRLESDYEFKLASALQQANEDWSRRVDQRGLDVAESWKLHLEAREKEFVEIERRLQKELADLDEKYTSLVNENNELRKNVDTEIRNEVDRVAALQQQINERQRYINDLTKAVQERQVEVENRNVVIENQKVEIENLKVEIGNQKVAIENQKVAMENQKVEIENQKVEIENQKVTIEKQKAEINNLTLTAVELRKQIEEENGKIESFAAAVKNQNEQIEGYKMEKQGEIEILKQSVTDLSNLSEEMEELRKSNRNLTTELTEKLEIIEDSRRKLDEFQSQEKFLNDQRDLLNRQVEEYQQQISNDRLQMQQQYVQIQSLNQLIEDYHRQKDAEINRLLQEQSVVLDSKSQENQTIIAERMNEMELLKRRLVDSENHYEEILSIKEADMRNLRIQLEEQTKKSFDYQAEREDFLQVQTELGIKTGECEELKGKLREQEFLLTEESKQLGELREIIQDQVLKIDDLQKELYEKSSLYDALIAEIDITNKPETTRKSTKRVQFSDDPEVANTSSSSTFGDDLTDPASRAELDLALYMLHQRDVRCEELTVELMQLLEERDTLQLKLSNALREKEILASKWEGSSSDEVASRVESSESVPSGSSEQQRQGAQESPRTSKSDPLVSKLSELRTVGYHKDKTILDEQELRRFQQLSIMQQHRDEASKLPPEAAARLVDASYTLSRDVQSPSKVLLNWLWGRSTPKVNNV